MLEHGELITAVELPAAAARGAARPTARSATGRRTPSRWSPSPPRSTSPGGAVPRRPDRARRRRAQAVARHRRRGGAARRAGHRGRLPGRRPRPSWRRPRRCRTTPSRSRWRATRSPPTLRDLAEERDAGDDRQLDAGAPRVGRHLVPPHRRRRPRCLGTATYACEHGRAQIPRLPPPAPGHDRARPRHRRSTPRAAEALDGVIAGAHPPQRAAAGRHRRRASSPCCSRRGVAFRGQLVGAVVAETPEIARHAADARRRRVRTAAARHRAARRTTPTSTGPSRSTRRTRPTPTRVTSTRALAAAAFTSTQPTRTPMEHNNPMEPHACIARLGGRARG